jgi:pantoate--beta-alanine ligase
MKVINSVIDLNKEIESFRSKNPKVTVGFVPTMGALHNGHVSLLHKAKQASELVVCSIFVNPTQFNNKEDLKNYPRTVDADLKILEENNCDIAFFPSESEIYPKNRDKYQIDLAGLDKVLEGKFRDDHFNGVCMVVERLFDIVKPDIAAFGLKDFQQVAIIKHMISVRNINVEILPCPILRETSGLAMSSRNALLSNQQKSEAAIIYKTLAEGKAEYNNGSDLETILEKMNSVFKKGNLKLEYLEIVDNNTLNSVEYVTTNLTCCIAAYSGVVRLIDNIQF